MLNRHMNPLVRGVGVMAAVVAVVVAVTFAALASRTALASSSLSTMTTTLKLWDGDSFESTAPGFTVTDLVPGIGKESSFYFKNEGGATLNVKAHVPGTPSASGFTGWNNLIVDITGEKCGDAVHTNMATLLSEEVALPCNALAAGAQGKPDVAGTEGNYKIKFDIVPAAIVSGKASVSNFDFVFAGVPQ